MPIFARARAAETVQPWIKLAEQVNGFKFSASELSQRIGQIIVTEAFLEFVTDKPSEAAVNSERHRSASEVHGRSHRPPAEFGATLAKQKLEFADGTGSLP